jgi:predicted GNAT family N-acyltransferase
MNKEKKRKQIQHLWKTVFDDSDEFIHLYFTKVYQDENALIIQKEGQIVSALQMLPYTMTFYGEEISVAYISGACTVPSEQGKGLMKKLLQNAFDEMKKRKIAVSALIPAGKWLFNYYRSQGYTEIFEYSLNTYIRNEQPLANPDGILVQPKENPDLLTYSYFDRKLRTRPLSIQHSYDDFAIILNDLNVSGGQFFVAFNSAKQPVGMAFVSPSEITKESGEGSLLIKELFYENEEVKERLLYEITRHYNLVKATYRTPVSNNQPAHPYGMAKVIDTERLIRLWVSAHPESSLSVSDLETMNVHALTRHLLGYSGRMAYMNLMLD